MNYNNNGQFHVNGNNNINNNGRSRGMALANSSGHYFVMKSYSNLYDKVCDFENIKLAWKEARKRKTLKSYVIEFDKYFKENLLQLSVDLIFHSYRPLPLNSFVIRDPKTRKISVSDFRDRIVHHAICNIIEPLFDKCFIFDNYANRKGKGTLAAIKRLNYFMRKVSHNGSIVKRSKNKVRGFFLKGDIKHYFETVNHNKLIELICGKIKDRELLFLINNILKNYSPKQEGVGMPLGNLTSQFFANVYLNELDQFVKHELKTKYYIRYVDDFVILHNDKSLLYYYKDRINEFLKTKLLIELSLNKSKIKPLNRGIEFLGFRNFYYHKILRERNIRKIYRKLCNLKNNYDHKIIDYDRVCEVFQGWMAYARNANTYKLRQKIIKIVEQNFPNEISTIEFNQIVKLVKARRK